MVGVLVCCSIIETSEYEPYGRLLNRANDNRAGYTGHVMDAVSGLTYMQQRYYDPSIGAFLSVDPVTANSGTGANFNRYWYANNSPYRFTDPDGRATVDEMIDSGAQGCGAVSCAGWAGLHAVWSVFGAEGISRIADRGWSNTSSGDRASAALELVAVLPSVKLLGKAAGALRAADDALVAAKGATPLLQAPRKIAAAWGSSTYRQGGLMTGIEHVMYRHGPNSGFPNVSRFAAGTRMGDISRYVDSALRSGTVTSAGRGAYTVEYNLGRTIGTDSAGNATSSIRVHVRDGVIQTAFPF